MTIWTFFLPLQEILDLEEFPITTDRAITNIAGKKQKKSVKVLCELQHFKPTSPQLSLKISTFSCKNCADVNSKQ